MLSETEKLTALGNLAAQLGQVVDLDILMETILAEARRFTGAEAGSIYIREEGRLLFSYTQNAKLAAALAPGDKLIYHTHSVAITPDSLAGFVALSGRPLNLPDVYQLENTAPYRYDLTFDARAGYHCQSMLALPLLNVRGQVIGVLQLINALGETGQIVPFDPEAQKLMQLFSATAAMSLERAQMTRAMILRTIRLAEMRDPGETGAHVNRVGAFAAEIYEHWASQKGLDLSEITRNRDLLRMAAMLHDVGKVGIADHILKKAGPLGDEEREAVRRHSLIGARLFVEQQSIFDEVALEVALTHHERWDGSGYPGWVDLSTGRPLPGYETADGGARGRRGEEIPLFGRITAVADVYDALCSRRAYKEPLPEEVVLDFIREKSGLHFDPEVVASFLARLEVLQAIRRRYPDAEE